MRGMQNLEIGLQQQKELKKSERRQLELSLDGLSFTCLQELNLPSPLDQVYLHLRGVLILWRNCIFELDMTL